MKKLSSLKEDTKIVCDCDWSETTVGVAKEEGLFELYKTWTWYIADMKEIEQPNIDVEYIIDHMDRECEDWRDKYGDCEELQELEKDFKIAFNKFRDSLGDKKMVYACEDSIRIDL